MRLGLLLRTAILEFTPLEFETSAGALACRAVAFIRIYSVGV